MVDNETLPDDQAEMVLTAIAKDRPGLVKLLADVIASHGGNWIDSSMARLGGEFAGILRIVIPRGQTAELEAGLARLAEEGIDFIIHRGTSFPAQAGARIRLELTGVDHPGIVLEVSRALAVHSVSIDELQTTVFPASMTGSAMFSAKADLVLPMDLDVAVLRDTLEQIAHDIMIDIELIQTK